MVSEINIGEGLSLNRPVIDVRSPGEFAQGHIPGAFNIPLFSDDERAQVGTLYIQRSKEEAIAKGYEFVTPKLDDFIKQSFHAAPDGNVVVHCWRGGMRSRAFAKHIDENGFRDVKVVTGGYKAYRNYVLDFLARPFKLKVLGGYTGSGKTCILHELKKLGCQVIDLEGMAHHKGSAFGGIGQAKQPTSEQFENNLVMELSRLDLQQTIWVEDESHNIGTVNLPPAFFRQLHEGIIFFIDIPKEERVRHLVDEYAGCDKKQLAESINRISKRLGGQHVKRALDELEAGNYSDVATVALQYYDKSYLRGIESRNKENIIRIPLPSVDHRKNAVEIERKSNTI